MAHPLKGETEQAHAAKLAKMTTHYGLANPSMNKLAPDDLLKGEGGESSVGFGADSSAAKSRGDRPARKTTSANPLATYSKGGMVACRANGGSVKARKRADGGPTGSKPYMPPDTTPGTPRFSNDLAKIGEKPAVSNDLARIGEKPTVSNELARPNLKKGGVAGRADGGAVVARARGGRTKHHGKGTHVNVIVAPQSGNGPPAGGGAPVLPLPPPKPPMMMPPPGGGPGGPPPGGPPMPPGGPMPMVPGPGGVPPRAMGGKVTGYDAGALSGEGRLQKIKNYGKKTARATPQTV